MALKFNNNIPKEIIYNGLNVAKVVYNNIVVWLQRILYTITGIPPLTANKSFGEPLVDYKIYGKSEQRNLPIEYQEVEYIETDGTCYIDTNFICDNNTRIKIKFRTASQIPTNSSTVLFYSGSGVENYGFAIASSGASGKYRAFYRGTYSASNMLQTSTDYTIEFNKEKFYLNNVLEYTFNSVQFVTAYTLPLFAQYYTRKSPTSFATNGTRMYYTLIWDNDILIRNLIPCYRKSDNEPGLYDTVNDVFYTNLGTGDFTVGANKTTPTPDRPMQIRNVGDRISPSGLPSGYEEVQYLQSTGTQYIDTEFQSNQDTRVTIKAQVPEGQTIGSGYRLFGSRDSANQNAFFLSTSSNPGKIYFNYNNDAVATDTLDYNIHIFDLNKNICYLDGNIVEEFTYSEFGTNYNAILFGGNSNGTIVTKAWKIYECKIYDNGTLIRNFVPCYRKSDDKPGMYDTVNDVFYTNDGTGEFTVGSSAMKYKIPIDVNNTTTNIYLDEPLRKVGNYADYIDYGEQKRVTNVEVIDNTGELPIEQSYNGLANPIEETITLPDILTNAGANIIDVVTEIQPSNMEIQYEGTKF